MDEQRVELETTVIKSSPQDFDNFLDSLLFQDFLTEIEVRKNQLWGMLQDEDLQYSGRDYDKFRGGLTNLEMMKTIFQDLKHDKEAYLKALEEYEKKEKIKERNNG